jgi:hypothetical protein
VLRHVSVEGPAGRVDDVVTAGRDLTLPGAPEGAPPSTAGSAQLPRSAPRSLSGRTPSTRARRLDAYEGDLVPFEGVDAGYEGPPEDWTAEPEPPDDDQIPEELPPPIFSALLAERTGKSLAELRPDLVDEHGVLHDPLAQPAPPPRAPGPRRRMSPEEMRRLGLGAPRHSDEGEGEAEGETEGKAPSFASPPAPPVEDDDVEYVEETVTLEEFFKGQAAAPPEAEAPEPESAPEPPQRDQRPTLRFRAAPGAPVRRMPSGDARLSETVPNDVRDAVRRATGIDPGDTTVRRGPEASVEATRIGAAAFTRDGEIFLPAEHGPVDGPETRAILAHELTHVVQHRVYGNRLPSPDSPSGRRLEAEARSVQRWVAGVDDAPALQPIGTSGAAFAGAELDELRDTAEQLVSSGLAHWAPDGSLVFGGGAMGGGDEPWAFMPGTLQEAIVEDRKLAEVYTSQRKAGSDTTESLAAYLDFHTEFEETYGDQLAQLIAGAGTTGATTGATGAKSIEDLKKEKEDLEYKHLMQSTTSYEERQRLSAEWARKHNVQTVSPTLFGHAQDYGRPSAQEAADEYQKQQDEIQKKIDELTAKKKARDDAAAGRTPTPTGTQPTTTGEQALIHPPSTGTPTADTPTGETGTGTGSGTQAAVKTAAATKVLTESQRLEQELKDEKEMWKLLDKQEELRAKKPADLSGSYESRYGGGVSFSGLFSNPQDYGREQQEKKYEKEQRRLDREIRMRERIEAAREREGQQQKRAEERAQQQTAAKDAKDAKTAVAGAKTGGAASATIGSGEDESTRAGQDAARHRGLTTTESEGAGQAVIAQLSDEDVEDLANLLYSRMVTRLRKDLIVDRERSGLLTDFR